MKIINLLIFILLSGYNITTAQVTTIPFELYKDKAILLKLLINDKKDTLTFFFDTGATASLLDSTAAAKMELVSDYEQKVDGASGSKTYKLVLNQTIYIGNKTKIDSTHLILENLSGLKKALEKQFDGIVGYSILSKYKTKIDFDKNIIELYDFDDTIDTTGYSKIDFTLNNGIPIPQFPVTIELRNGKQYTDTIFFDSGAGLTLVINTPFKNKNKLQQNIGKILASESQNLSSHSISQDAIIKL